jgi:DNA-binding transcriptional regulator YhcF (GntR family)
MTVVSTKEFNTNQKKYFDLAMNGEVFIQRGSNRFLVTCAPKPERVRHKEPDEDLQTAITKDELLEGLYEYIDKMFAVNE